MLPPEDVSYWQNWEITTFILPRPALASNLSKCSMLNNTISRVNRTWQVFCYAWVKPLMIIIGGVYNLNKRHIYPKGHSQLPILVSFKCQKGNIPCEVFFVPSIIYIMAWIYKYIMCMNILKLYTHTRIYCIHVCVCVCVKFISVFVVYIYLFVSLITFTYNKTLSKFNRK